MDKIGKPRNLIGYFSENMIRLKEKPTFTGRMMAYTAVITILVTVLSYFIFSRSDMDMTVMRSAGMLYQQQPGGYISNIYNAEIINKTDKNKRVTIAADDPAIKIKYIQAPAVVARGGTETKIRLRLVAEHQVIQTVITNFIGPIND
jgi:polyferredoxin